MNHQPPFRGDRGPLTDPLPEPHRGPTTACPEPPRTRKSQDRTPPTDSPRTNDPGQPPPRSLSNHLALTAAQPATLLPTLRPRPSSPLVAYLPLRRNPAGRRKLLRPRDRLWPHCPPSASRS